MRRYDIVSGILLILSIIDFAFAAPVLVQEKRQASPRDVITVLEKRGDEGLMELAEEYFKTWEKPVASSGTHSSSSSAPSGPDPGSTNAVQPPAPNAASSTANPDPLTDPSSCSSEHGLQARGNGNCIMKAAKWLDDVYDSHEGIDGYNTRVPLTMYGLGAPDLVPFGGLTTTHVPQSYPGYSRPSYSAVPDYSKPSDSAVPDYSKPSDSADPNFDWNYWRHAEDVGQPPSPSKLGPHFPGAQKAVGEASGYAMSKPFPGSESTDLESQPLDTDSQPEDSDPEAVALYAEKGKAKIPGTVRDVGNLA